jgi:hypothetical protein
LNLATVGLLISYEQVSLSPLITFYATLGTKGETETAAVLAPSAELEINVEDLGPQGATYLIVNNSTAYESSIEIALVEYYSTPARKLNHKTRTDGDEWPAVF